MVEAIAANAALTKKLLIQEEQFYKENVKFPVATADELKILEDDINDYNINFYVSNIPISSVSFIL